MLVEMNTAETRELESVTSYRKIKNKIVKTYQHEISMSYEGLQSRSDVTREDSDPDETQRVMSELQQSTPFSTLSSQHSAINSRAHTNQCQQSINHSELMTGKRSIGGFSTGDSGVVSHDSLLDRCRDGSYTRSERSLSPPDSSMLSSRPSVGEFDAVNRASILDSRYRSRSKSRIEEQQRGKSPCRGHGVRDMISFFEGSQENIATATTSKGSLLMVPTHTPPLIPLRQSRLNNSLSLGRWNNSRGSNSVLTSPAPNGDCEDIVTNSTSTPNGKPSKQEDVIHLACVASGYSQYSPYNERKNSHQNNGINSTNSTSDLRLGNSETSSVPTTQPRQLHNGATCNGSETSGDANQNSIVGHNEGEGDRLALLQHKTSSTHVNGLGESSTGSGDAPDPGVKGTLDTCVSTDEIGISIRESETSQPSNGGVYTATSGGESALDEVDRATRLQEHYLPQTELRREDMKLILNSQSAESSPSKKGGEWFLKVTDNAQSKLMSLAQIAQEYLETQDLPDDVCGQIRAAIGKANLLVNKKFKQFRGLCNKNLTQGPDEPFPTTSQDLAGFWDLVSLQVTACETGFSDIERLRRNDWIIERVPSTENLCDAVKKPTTPRTNKSMEASLGSENKSKARSSASKQSDAARARNEARKRLMAAKKAMRERRNSESEDVIFVSQS